jgi:hypothetical protein
LAKLKPRTSVAEFKSSSNTVLRTFKQKREHLERNLAGYTMMFYNMGKCLKITGKEKEEERGNYVKQRISGAQETVQRGATATGVFP